MIKTPSIAFCSCGEHEEGHSPNCKYLLSYPNSIRDAEREGYEAYAEGLARIENPYSERIWGVHYQAWDTGWVRRSND